MSEARKKLLEAGYFLQETSRHFRSQKQTFIFNLNAFISSARNITFVMQKEGASLTGFDEWYRSHPIKDDERARRFVNLRNVSTKEKMISPEKFSIKGDFGPEGLRVIGMKGPTSVKSDIIKLDKPIPEYSYVTVSDDNGYRRVKYRLYVDFSIEEAYDHGKKSVEFLEFIREAQDYMQRLEALVDEFEEKFLNRSV